MAITGTNLTFGEQTTSGTSATTASISPTANKLVIVSTSDGPPGNSVIPTVTGAGMTWTLISSQGDGSTGTHIVALFRGLSASPGSGALTISYGATSQNRISWSVDQFDGINTSGSNGSGAIVQSAGFPGTNITSTGITINLSALASANNAAMGFVFSTALGAIVAGTGFTELSNHNGDGEFESEWSINKTAISWTWASQTTTAVGIAVEIRAQSASTNPFVNVWNLR